MATITQTARYRGGRYNGLAVALHWTIATLILFQIAYAWWGLGAQPDHSAAQAQALTFHMSIGLTILLLSVLRLVVRLVAPPPPLPADMPGPEKTIARATHVLFYLLIIGIPFGGWFLASLNPAPISWFGLFTWPHVPFVQTLAPSIRHALHKPVGIGHTIIGVWTILLLLVLHVAGAVKDQVTGPPVFWRMVPGVRRPPLS
jgi:cytochrome b561